MFRAPVMATAWLLTLLTACGDSGVGSGGGGSDGEAGASSSTGGANSGGANSGGGGASGGSGGEGGSRIPAVEDPYQPAPAPSEWSSAELADLQAGVDSALNGISGATHSALIVGLDSGQVLYQRSPDSLRKPASNTKLFTTAVGLVEHGASHRPLARLYRANASGATISGDITLVLEHDPSASTWFADSATQPLEAAAEALAASGVTQVTGNAVVKGEGVFVGSSLGTISFSGERAEIATAFLNALEGAGIAVAGNASNAAGFDPPAGATLIAELPAASNDVIAHAINVPSHNEFADLWSHHLGQLASGTNTFAGGFAAMEASLDGLGVAHPGLLLNDGSGLSHDNRVSARHIVDLFVAMAEQPSWDAYVKSMAVSGLRGTIASRMTGPDTNARFWGKTGTLTGVVALSGVLFHKHDGQRYVASFLVNSVSDSPQARARLDQAVASLGEDRRNLADLPAAPRLLALDDDDNGASAVARFTPVDGASGYLLWRSADGLTWKREDARLIDGTTHRTLSFDGALFVRVTALNEAGEGPPSSVLAVRCSQDGPKILVVDGNERHSSQPVPENPLRWGHSSLSAYAAALDAPFESASHAQIDSGEVDLSGYDSVIWLLGRESVADETFSVAEQERVRQFVESGGALVVSGAELGYDLIDQGSPEDAAFAREVLGLEYVADDAGTTLLRAGELDLGVFVARFSKLGTSEVAFPDVLAPAGEGVSCLTYASGGDACVVTDFPAGGRAVSLGLPLESLDDPALLQKIVALGLGT